MTQTPSRHPAVHHEESDVEVGAIFKIGTGLVILAAVIHVVIWLMFGYFNSREAADPGNWYPLAAGQEMRLPPPPRLQVTPRQDLRDLRAREEKILNSYQWVDRKAGTVRIPISEAMQLTLRRGFPVLQSPQPGTP